MVLDYAEALRRTEDAQEHRKAAAHLPHEPFQHPAFSTCVHPNPNLNLNRNPNEQAEAILRDATVDEASVILKSLGKPRTWHCRSTRTCRLSTERTNRVGATSS